MFQNISTFKILHASTFIMNFSVRYRLYHEYEIIMNEVFGFLNFSIKIYINNAQVKNFCSINITLIGYKKTIFCNKFSLFRSYFQYLIRLMVSFISFVFQISQ